MCFVKLQRWAQIIGVLDMIYYSLYFFTTLGLGIYLDHELRQQPVIVPKVGFPPQQTSRSPENPLLTLRRQTRFHGNTSGRLSADKEITAMVELRHEFLVDSLFTLLQFDFGLLLWLSGRTGRKPGTATKLALVWLLGNLILLQGYTVWRISDSLWISLGISILIRIAPFWLVIAFIISLQEGHRESQLLSSTVIREFPQIHVNRQDHLGIEQRKLKRRFTNLAIAFEDSQPARFRKNQEANTIRGVKWRRWVLALGILEVIYHFLYFLMTFGIIFYLNHEMSLSPDKFLAELKEEGGENPLLGTFRRARFDGKGKTTNAREAYDEMAVLHRAYILDSFFALVHLDIGIALVMSARAYRTSSTSLNLAFLWVTGNLLLVQGYSVWRIRECLWITLATAVVGRLIPFWVVLAFTNRVRRKAEKAENDKSAKVTSTVTPMSQVLLESGHCRENPEDTRRSPAESQLGARRFTKYPNATTEPNISENMEVIRKAFE